MQRKLLKATTLLLGLALTASLAGQSAARATVTPTERCSTLNHQLQEVLKSTAAANKASAARAAQKKAARLCASRKQAEGILAFANALQLLGVKPVDPDREPVTASIKRKEANP